MFNSRANSAVDHTLTAFIEGRAVDKSGLIGDDLAPEVETEKLSGHYFGSLSQNLILLDNYGLREPGSPSQRMTNDYESKPYDIKMYGAHDVLSPTQLKKADNALKLEESTVSDIQDGFLINREKHIIDSLIDISRFQANGMYIPLTGQDRWDTDTGMVIPKVTDANTMIIEAIGAPATHTFTSQRVYDAISKNGDTLERLKKMLGAITVLNEDYFMQMMNNKKVPFINKFRVSSATYRTNKRKINETAADQQFGFCFPDIFLVCRLETYDVNRKQSKTFAANLVPNDQMEEAGQVVETFWDQKEKVTYYEVNEYRDPRIINEFAAVVIDTPITV